MVEKYYSPLTDMYERLNTWKQFHKDIDTKLRLLYLECRQNLEFLEILNLQPGNDKISTHDPDYISITRLLTTEVLEMIFLEGKKNSKFYEVLRKVMNIEEDEVENKKEKQHKKEKSIIQACVYLYVKITTLQRIIGIERKGKALKKIYLRTRLHTIKDNFIDIVKSLGEHKEIREITTDPLCPSSS
jgi:hypothetical protein